MSPKPPTPQTLDELDAVNPVIHAAQHGSLDNLLFVSGPNSFHTQQGAIGDILKELQGRLNALPRAPKAEDGTSVVLLGIEGDTHTPDVSLILGGTTVPGDVRSIDDAKDLTVSTTILTLPRAVALQMLWRLALILSTEPLATSEDDDE